MKILFLLLVITNIISAFKWFDRYLLAMGLFKYMHDKNCPWPNKQEIHELVKEALIHVMNQDTKKER